MRGVSKKSSLSRAREESIKKIRWRVQLVCFCRNNYLTHFFTLDAAPLYYDDG